MQSNDLVYNRIADCLNDCRRIISSSSWLVNTNRSINEVEGGMREPMQLAIVGRISSSKSTLVNAILGKPEVVRTGHEAETFNVSWLKYGDDNAPIVVYFRNGDIEKIDRRAWGDWASHKGEASLKAKVKYIEVTSSYDMLKYINIIDTPGLDAASKVDSENTIDFLKTIHPDAVVLLFSKSLSEDSLRLIQDFQNPDVGVSFSINPMNALGLLSKMDMNWNIMDNNDALQTSASAIQRTLSNRSDVSKSLFRILPISALMGLASFCISEEDVADFRELASIGDLKSFTKLFISVDFFVKPHDFVSVSIERRKNLIFKYGLYGIFVCVKAIQQNHNTTVLELSQLLKDKSGFSVFFNLLKSHFGDRAALIKAQQGIIKLLGACDKDKQYANTAERQELLSKIYARVLNIETELHELKEWSLLLSIYEGKTSVNDEFLREFLFICGENGHAAINKLNVSPDTNVKDMVHIAEERCQYWRAKYNSTRNISVKRALPYETISKSYEMLGARIREQHEIYEKAIREISLYNHYIYGRE